MQKRLLLWYLLVFLLICNTMVVLNMSIAIVSMVKIHVNTDEFSDAAVCPNTSSFVQKMFKNQQTNLKVQNIGYDWTAAEQNMILSGGCWLSVFAILPGSVLTQKFGSKRVIGLTQFIASVMSSLIPILSDYGPIVVAWIRAIQGLLTNVAVPTAMFTIIANWSPPEERGWFGTTFLVGISLGMSVGNSMFGYIAQYYHWKFIFHLTSVCGLIWTLLWYTLIYDSPRQHPTITVEEKEYIEESLRKSVEKCKVFIPWKNILTSIPVLVCIIATNAAMWAFVMMNTYLPLYLKTIYGINSSEIGIVTGIPQFFAGIVALGIGYYSDLVIKKRKLSMTNIRKICTLTGSIIATFPMIVMAFVQCNINVVIICVIIGSVSRTAGNFGSPLAIMDMSPKFCGILEGISGTVGSILSIVFSTAINYFTNIWDIEKLWKTVFLFTALYAIVTNVVYLIFGTSKVQKWNFEDIDTKNKSNDVGAKEKFLLASF